MKKLLVWGSLLGLLVAGTAWGQTAGTNAVSRNGYCFNSTTGQLVDCTTGAALTSDAARDRDYVLAPVQIFNGTIAAGAADSTSIVDLSAYRTVALLVQWGMAGGNANAWHRFATSGRYNLGGASDSLSLFALPISTWDDSTVALAAPGRISGTAVSALGAGEFPITIVNTGSGVVSTASLPQGKMVFLTVPQGFAWPSNCSFRFRNIGRSIANTPTLRVWVTGTAK